MANQQQTPWAVLLCKFKDDQSETPVSNFREVCQKFFTTAGVGTYNALAFFQDMSHGHLDLSGSQVLGWYTLDVNVNNTKSQNEMMALAKQAATNAGVPLNTFFGVVLIMNVATGWAQGGPAGVFADWRRVDGRNLDGSLGPRVPGGGNGTEIFGQEMGHGYGLGHSRRDGSNEDYQDRWDIMSTDNANSVADPDYCARGPGLNAWNMRGRGWLDESRVWHGPGTIFDQIIELRPLHRPDFAGWLAAELPPNDGAGGHGRYLVEFRFKERWDAGIPRSAVLVHRYLTAAQDNDGSPHSYILSGINGNQDLVEGDVLLAPGVSGEGTPRVEVLQINENENDPIATVRLSYITMEADKGSFSTMDVRPWDKPQLNNSALITFAQPFSAAPSLPLGIIEMDMDRKAGIRISATTALVTKQNFRVNIDSWADTVLYSGGCAWIEIAPENSDIQWGQFNTQEDHPWDQPQVSTTKQITFPRPYAAPPSVVVWLNELDMNSSAGWRVNAYATAISQTGFALHIDTWADSILYSAGATWIAYSADNPNIASGTFNTQDVRPWNQPQPNNSNAVTFPHSFGTTPKVTVGLNSIDIDNTNNLRISATASDATSTGLTWHLDSWADTILYSAGGAYIAQI